MNARTWLSYFEDNITRPETHLAAAEAIALEPPVHEALVRSLQHVHLGETGEGTIVAEASTSTDPSLDDATRRSIALYIAEEHRHGREVARILTAMGATVIGGHWTDELFARGRRLLGFRTKMLTIGAAEAVGVELYRLLRDRIDDPRVRRTAGVIAREEEQHLHFLAAWIRRVVAVTPPRRRAVHRHGLRAWLGVIRLCAVAVFIIDHGPLLEALREPRRSFARRCIENGASLSSAFVERSGRASDVPPRARVDAVVTDAASRAPA